MFKVIIPLLLVSLAFTQKVYSTEEYINTTHGSFKITDRDSNIVVSAPHGTYDINTGEITDRVCKKLEVNCIVSKGFIPKGTRINVNRPTEGVGIKSGKEPVTERARNTYKTYLDAITRITNRNLEWYFEIHGSKVKGMEVALHNLTKDEAIIIKAILEEQWSSESNTKTAIKVQGIDKIRMTGNAVKKFGVVHKLQPKYVQFEFSRELRNDKKLLSGFLVGAIKRIKNELE